MGVEHINTTLGQPRGKPKRNYMVKANMGVEHINITLGRPLVQAQQ